MTQLDHFLASWVDLVCAVIAISTLGKYRPNWEMDIRCWMTLRRLKK